MFETYNSVLTCVVKRFKLEQHVNVNICLSCGANIIQLLEIVHLQFHVYEILFYRLNYHVIESMSDNLQIFEF